MPKRRPKLVSQKLLPFKNEFYLGIDPGKSGGLAITSPQGIVSYTKMPTTELDLFNWIKKEAAEIKLAMIEKVHAMPGQGVTSMFTFGQGYGTLRMAVISCGIPLNEIHPKSWQKGMGVAGRKKTETKPQFKDRLRQKAQQLHPAMRLWNNPLGEQRAVCDAILIAEYLRKVSS